MSYKQPYYAIILHMVKRSRYIKQRVFNILATLLFHMFLICKQLVRNQSKACHSFWSLTIVEGA
ncbi:hypothetical protein CI102_7611 [Trichoderma harzianum]|nr:hypothetical protein CI102_7611 [Trichoderma harzianum]